MVLKLYNRSYFILHNIEGENKKRSLNARNEQRLRNFQKADALGKIFSGCGKPAKNLVKNFIAKLFLK
ncbi:MAG: hypothetical protein WD554_00715 [Flavobacteriaceae bacterium]